MAEYIEREAVVRAFCEHCRDYVDKCTYDGACEVDIIATVPTADVQPVKWISVKDRLPDDCVEVLVRDTDCGILIGWYDKKDSVFVAEFINQLDAVTHWMPLPEPPQD